MNRRKFLKIGIITVAAGLAGFLMFPSFKRTVRSILHRDTKRLRIQSNAVDTFTREAEREQFWIKFHSSKKMLIVFYTYAGFLKTILPYYNKYIQYRGQITGHFLLSTDFFIHKMDTAREIEYVQFYNPYKQPCYNPFSSIFYPEKV